MIRTIIKNKNINYLLILEKLYNRLNDLYIRCYILNSKYPAIDRNKKTLLYLSYKNKIQDLYKCFKYNHKCKYYNKYKLELNNYLLKYPKNIIYE